MTLKFTKEHKLYKVLSLNSLSVGVSMLLGIFSTKIISVFLGTQGMAMMGSFRNFSTMIKSLATLGINNSLIKLFVENKENKEELSIIYATFFWIFLTLSAVLGIIVFAFSGYISRFIFSGHEYSLPIDILAVALPFIVLNTFWMAVYNALESFRKIILIQIISNVLIFAITVLFVWSGNIHGGLLSIALSELAMVAVTWFFVRRNSMYFRFDMQKIISKKHVAIIKNFSVMAMLTAIVAPVTLILIRNSIVAAHSFADAGIWDGVNRLSGFYMVFFNTGLALYYVPKLSSLQTDNEFKVELKSYFSTMVPLFAVMLIIVFLFRGLIVDVAFTNEFVGIKKILIWQLAGDMFRIMTLAFGFQILVKTMMKEYFIVEIAFNLFYILGSLFLMQLYGSEGVVKAYFFSNVLCFVIVLLIFRKLLFNRA